LVKNGQKTIVIIIYQAKKKRIFVALAILILLEGTSVVVFTFLDPKNFFNALMYLVILFKTGFEPATPRFSA
jgi:hypothetical protein